MAEALISLVSQNLILSLIVVILLLKGISSGGFTGIIRWVVLVVMVVFGVKACERWMSESIQTASNQVSETVLGGICRVIRIGPLCDVVGVYEGAEASEANRQACYDNVINDPAVYHIGGATVARNCEAHRQDLPAWQSCVDRGFQNIDALNGRLLPCQPYSSESIFDQFRNYSRPFACIFGIDRWCEVDRDPEVDAAAEAEATALREFERLVRHQPYLDCMHRIGLDYGLRADACYDLLVADPTDNARWARCLAGVAENELAPHVSHRELARCRNLVQ